MNLQSNAAMREAFRFAYLGDDDGVAESCAEIEAIARGELLHVWGSRSEPQYNPDTLTAPRRNPFVAKEARENRKRIVEAAAKAAAIKATFAFFKEREERFRAERDERLCNEILRGNDILRAAAIARVSAAPRLRYCHLCNRGRVEMASTVLCVTCARTAMANGELKLAVAYVEGRYVRACRASKPDGSSVVYIQLANGEPVQALRLGAYLP